MAKCDFKLPEDFLLRISKLGDQTDTIIPKVLDAGGEVVEAKVRSNLMSVIGKDLNSKKRSTGQLVGALGISSARQDKDGNFNVKVGFSENRTDGKSNALLAGVLEYGKHGQPPRPFLKPARPASKAECLDAMKAKLDEEVQKI